MLTHTLVAVSALNKTYLDDESQKFGLINVCSRITTQLSPTSLPPPLTLKHTHTHTHSRTPLEMPLHAHIIHDIDGDTFRAKPTPTLTLTLTILHYTLLTPHTHTHTRSCLCVCVKNLQFLVLFSSSCLIFCNHSRKSCQSTLSSLDDQQPPVPAPAAFSPTWPHRLATCGTCACVRNRYPQPEPSQGIV